MASIRGIGLVEFEDIYGIKVDVRIPDEDKQYFSAQWRRWLNGENSEYTSLERTNLETRYEHFLKGSGVGIPPDPFKPLAGQASNADLERVIEARRKQFCPGEEYQLSCIVNWKIPGLAELIQLPEEELDWCSLIALYPEISQDGRITVPQVVGVDYKGQRMDLKEDIIAKIKLPLTHNLKGETGKIIKEIFDFQGGYRLELGD